jgi:acyl-CoA synthetase (AMP-forming)/AMP-acid ligase II
VVIAVGIKLYRDNQPFLSDVQQARDLDSMIGAECRPWLVEGGSGKVTTYGELRARLERGEVRHLCQPATTAEALREIAAALAFGSELTLLDPDAGEQDLAALGLKFSDVNCALRVTPDHAIDLDALRAAAGGASAARLGLFTSGSTGLPKLVRQSVANLARAVKVSPRHAGAVWAFAYNPTHVAGIQVFLQALANGCTLVNVYGLDRAAVLAALERHGVTHLSATPSFYRLLLPSERPLHRVRSVTLGGESADSGLLGRLRGLFPSARFHNIYASTEAGTLLVAEGDVFGIADGLEDRVQIRDGRIYVHASLLGEFVTGERRTENGQQRTEDPPSPIRQAQGYGEASRELRTEDGGRKADRSVTTNQEPTTPAAPAADWYDTGDMVEIVTEKPLRFRIVARERDWVNVGGSKVNPREVEAALEEHPGVRQARVTGRANSVMGQILVAEVECAGSRPTEAALREHLAARLQPFKVPRLIRFVDQIEQTRTGKVSRR